MYSLPPLPKNAQLVAQFTYIGNSFVSPIFQNNYNALFLLFRVTQGTTFGNLGACLLHGTNKNPATFEALVSRPSGHYVTGGLAGNRSYMGWFFGEWGSENISFVSTYFGGNDVSTPGTTINATLQAAYPSMLSNFSRVTSSYVGPSDSVNLRVPTPMFPFISAVIDTNQAGTMANPGIVSIYGV